MNFICHPIHTDFLLDYFNLFASVQFFFQFVSDANHNYDLRGDSFAQNWPIMSANVVAICKKKEQRNIAAMKILKLLPKKDVEATTQVVALLLLPFLLPSPHVEAFVQYFAVRYTSFFVPMHNFNLYFSDFCRFPLEDERFGGTW
jgi:hypothetical protein